MANYSIALILIISSIVIAGCGGGGDGSSDATELEGSWSNDCTTSSIGTFNGSKQWTDNYSGLNYRATNQFYDSFDCSGPVLFQNEMLGTIVIGGSLIAGSGVDAYAIDLFIDSTSATGQIPAGAFLGFVAGDSLYDIYHLDGNDLYFGDFNTGLGNSPETRPTDINFSQPFRRQ